MREERQFILSKDGLELSSIHFQAPNPKAVMCIVHGLGEHMERYRPMAEFLNGNDLAVTGIDLRGHGISEGKKGHAKNLDVLLSDIEELMKFTRAEYTELPLFLFGHSLGGNLVANYMKTQKTSEISGFILSAPFFKVNFEPPKWKVTLAEIIGSIWPSLTQPSGLDTSALSRSAKEVKKYENDDLIHDKISVGLFLSSTKRGAEVITNSKELKVNGLVYHGTGDGITCHEASKEFSENNQSQVKFISLEGAYHEPHNDECRHEVHDMILDFLKRNS